MPVSSLATNDIIKVEVWDVVDKGVQSGELKASSSALKIDNNTPTSPSKTKSAPDTESVPHAGFALDASTIDVYRNTDGVILVYDISKPWTFDYAAKALADVPTNIPVLILSNFSDDSNPRPVVASDRVVALMTEHNNSRSQLPCAPANLVRHLETSMKTGLGLKEIHESFGIPFLNVLRETHRKQFEQKTLEIEELLRTLDGNVQDRSARHRSQKSISFAPAVPAKDDLSSRKLPPLPVSIQTSGPNIHHIPQTSSPTSPARKTRNEHTNIDILSPTPLAPHPPAVLLEFNSGKLEDDFFQNVDLDSTAPSVVDEGAAVPPVEKTTEVQDEAGGNPIVTEDEDIAGDFSTDELADVSSHQTQAPVWVPGDVEKELMGRHMVKGSEEMQLEEEQAAEVDHHFDFGQAQQQHESDDFEAVVDDSDYSAQDIVPTTTYSRDLRRDSDASSHIDFPVASAMYYEHEPSGFAHRVDVEDEEILNKPTATSDVVLSGYEEIADGHGNNPWGSTGELLRGVAAAAPHKDIPQSENAQEHHATEDTNEVTPEAVAGSSTSNAIGRDNGKRSVDMTVSASVAINGGRSEDHKDSPTLSIQTEASGADPEEEDENDNEGSLASGSLPNAEEASEANAADKKKTKKKSKKKGKKGK
ncbi:Rab-like protein 6 [Mortierella sp. GBA30]|nr:Rab-like protein 6 [Mortierella sp. GBA30]